MDISTSNPFQETQNHSPINYPLNNNINGSSSSSSNSHTPPLTPKSISISISRSESINPTTFIQANTNNFKQVVQMMTGSSETAKQQATKTTTTTDHTKGGLIPPIQKKQSFKLYERRNHLKNGLLINSHYPGGGQNSRFSPRKMEMLSPSILDFPALLLSPVTPLIELEDPFNKSPTPTPTPNSIGSSSSSEEEKAIAQKKFYLHPSPRTTSTGPGPQLLPLFPLTSPRLSSGFSS